MLNVICLETSSVCNTISIALYLQLQGQDIAMGLKADDGSSVATADKSEASKKDANEASGSKDVTSGAADTSTGADTGGMT